MARVNGPWELRSNGLVWWRDEIGCHRHYSHKVVKNFFADGWFWLLIDDTGQIHHGTAPSLEEGRTVVDRLAESFGFRLLNNRYSIFI